MWTLLLPNLLLSVNLLVCLLLHHLSICAHLCTLQGSLGSSISVATGAGDLLGSLAGSLGSGVGCGVGCRLVTTALDHLRLWLSTNVEKGTTAVRR